MSLNASHNVCPCGKLSHATKARAMKASKSGMFPVLCCRGIEPVWHLARVPIHGLRGRRADASPDESASAAQE